MNDIKELLQKSKLKATPQRVAILKSIEKLGHASIEEIYEDIKENFPSISLATIYKNINFLKDEKILTEINIRDLKPKYEIIKPSHGHFICKVCKKIIDFEVESVCNPIHKEIKRVDESDVFLYGICKDCK
jgi:Fur family peroxide stress response transcriptional regulator